MPIRERVRVHIAGLVQGVGFRYGVTREARKRGLGGWVRNLPDGRVEAVFEGERLELEAMLDWCTHGPALARVDTVESTQEEVGAPFEEFEITF